MLSQAHPIMNLFETIENEPLNYLQAATAVRDLVMIDASVSPDLKVSYHDAPIEEVDHPNIEKRYMKLDLSKINASSIERYRSAFHKLGEFVTKRKTEVKFLGLTEKLRKHTKESCCSWSCQHKPSPKRELLQLLTAIQSQSKPSTQRYVIEVVSGK